MKIDSMLGKMFGSYQDMSDIISEVGPASASSLPQNPNHLELLCGSAAGKMNQGPTEEQSVLFLIATCRCTWQVLKSSKGRDPERDPQLRRRWGR